MKSVIRFAAVGAVGCAVAIGAGCESSTGRTELRRGVSAPAEPTAFGDVIVYDVEPGAPYRELGRVFATADARYEHRIEHAERLAIAELRRRAGEIGADAVVDVQREVVKMAPQPIETSVAGSFEDSRRDLLRPGSGDVAAARPTWRVRMSAAAVKMEGADASVPADSDS